MSEIVGQTFTAHMQWGGENGVGPLEVVVSCFPKEGGTYEFNVLEIATLRAENKALRKERDALRDGEAVTCSICSDCGKAVLCTCERDRLRRLLLEMVDVGNSVHSTARAALPDECPIHVEGAWPELVARARAEIGGDDG